MGLLLEADSIYYEVNGREIVKGAHLACKQGEVVGLLGRNGCGKSTMLEIIFGTWRGGKSFVRIGEEVLTGRAYRKGLIRMLPQFEYIPKSLRVSMVLWLENISEKELDDELIRKIYTCKIGELSGGLLKYFQIFLLLKSSAPFVLLDEPFAGLSPIVVEKILKMLCVAKVNKGIVISDHNIDAVAKISDRLMYMEDGQTIEVANLEDLKGRYFR